MFRVFVFQEDICHHTEETLRDVKICPQSDTIWRQQMQIKNCSSHPTCKGEPLVYHCVKWNDTFIEVCAPSAEITGNTISLYMRPIKPQILIPVLPCNLLSPAAILNNYLISKSIHI